MKLNQHIEMLQKLVEENPNLKNSYVLISVGDKFKNIDNPEIGNYKYNKFLMEKDFNSKENMRNNPEFFNKTTHPINAVCFY